MKADVYGITINGKDIYTDLTQGDYFRIMEDLAIEFYQTGAPHPDDIITRINGEPI